MENELIKRTTTYVDYKSDVRFDIETYEDRAIPAHLKRFNAFWESLQDGWKDVEEQTNSSNENEVKAYMVFNALCLTGQLLKAIKLHKKIQDNESEYLEYIMSSDINSITVNTGVLKHEEGIRQIAESLKIGWEVRKDMLDVLAIQLTQPGYEKAKKLFLEKKDFEFSGNWEWFYNKYMETEVVYEKKKKNKKKKIF